ncbi:MAG: carboxypeptidase regulatory-like domain-containing protein [Acidobacteriota bacterium]
MLRVSKFALAVLAVVLFPALAQAQGSITGTVRDSSGGVLPGVTVEAASPVLIEKVRSVVTDATGQYRIVDLRPGTYAVTFTLTGFNAARQEGIELTGSFTATVNGEMRVGTVAETITVTADTPIVDVQAVTRQRVFSDAVLEAIPAGRSYLNVAVLLPGVTATQAGRGTVLDVGGTTNLQTTSFQIHGGRTTDSRVMVDGVRIGNALATSSVTNFVPNQGSTSEVTIDYSAASAEQPYGGLKIDLIPREGSNNIRGTLFAFWVNEKWQGNNLSQDLRDRGLAQPNAMQRSYDINPSLGGPLVKDKLWFYSSARFQEGSSYVGGVYGNKNAGDPTKWTLDPDLSQRGVFFVRVNSGNTRLTWQAAQKHKITFFYDNQWRTWDDGRAGVSPESFVNYRFPLNRLGQIGWTSPLTNTLLIEARFANRGEGFGNLLPAEGSLWRSLIPVSEQSSGIWYRGKGGDGGANAVFGKNAQNIWMTSLALSRVTGAHAFKFGFTNNWATTVNTSASNDSNLSFRFNNAVPNQITMYGTPTRTSSQIRADTGLYAQDRWTHRRMTLNLGVRYDHFEGGYPEQYLGPALWQPTRNLTFSDTVGNSVHGVTPRAGIGYDVFGNGKTAVKVNIGKYPLAIGTTGDPAGITNAVTRTWTDANRNFAPDCNLLNLQSQDLRTSGGDFCGTVSDLNFGLPSSVTAYNPDTRFGWDTREYNWEFGTSVQHQLVPRVALDVGYFRRWFGNQRVVQNRATTAADYDLFSFVAPSDPRLPGGGGYVIGGLYNLNPNRVGVVDNYTTLSSQFGEQYEHWNGVDLSVNARLEGGLLVQGGLSTGRTSTDTCDIVAKSGGNPSPLYCHVDTKFLTQVKMLGSYTLPRVDVQFAATFQSTPGPAISANYLATNADVQSTLGRPLSGGAANVTVNLVAPGTLYGDRANQLDLRFSRAFKFSQRRVAINLDVYNALNANPVAQLNNNFAVWQTPQRIMEARLFKLSTQIDF